MTGLVQYIQSHSSDIIMNTFFAFFGFFISILLTPKNDSTLNTNGSSINNTIQFIQQNVVTYQHQTVHTSRRSPQTGSRHDNDDNSTLAIWVVGLFVIAFLYVKYHEEIIYFLTGFMCFAIVSTITIAIRLYRNNQYDNLNRFWTALALLIVIIDFITLRYMDKQIDTSTQFDTFSNFLNSAGIDGVLSYSYLAAGFIFVIIPNLLLMILLIHMFSVNIFLATRNRFAGFIIRKTKPFTIKPAAVATIGIIICVLSLLFSSGTMYNWISKLRYDNQYTTTHETNTKILSK